MNKERKSSHYNGANFWWNNSTYHANFSGQNIPPSYGPAGLAGGMVSFGIGPIAAAAAEEKGKGNYFTLQLDNDLAFVKEDLETQYHFHDLKELENRYNNNNELKRHYFIPLENTVRLISYDRKIKKYDISTIASKQ